MTLSVPCAFVKTPNEGSNFDNVPVAIWVFTTDPLPVVVSVTLFLGADKRSTSGPMTVITPACVVDAAARRHHSEAIVLLMRI
ncbi:hypothetical protein G3480_25665 [Thiorhodococcus mannitoliphagus]|uniref:Uncharacterized protein n=1 Tax=Thiorhodococcus mannitoliphagus TaxID=329406 RepID=A0A6P1E514_9GAMM|nr:hypothetical protein [Thiorhodococcus mannitoliphagus]NEX23622.1 hypothetical protein [Thiorhodococcus mannitoliphagus]